MKILIACEESQAVCKAFRAKGHEAYSCDIQKCSGGFPEYHIIGDALEEAYSGKYEMMIAFPPCTHLAVSGARHFKQKQKDGRQQKAIEFFIALYNAPIKHIAIENPVCIMSTHLRKPDQIIQPYQFGHEAQKTTCLWLRNLQNLAPTKIVSKGEFFIYPNGKKMSKWMCKPDNEIGKKQPYNRQKLRSKTFQGIAEAMANQWSKPKYIEQLSLWSY